MSEPQPSNAARYWAIAGLVLACIWLLFALLPVPGTTLMGLPFLALALIGTGVGLYLWRERRTRWVLPWAGGALGISCFGCVWQIAVAVMMGTMLIGGGYSLWQYLQGTPMP